MCASSGKWWRRDRQAQTVERRGLRDGTGAERLGELHEHPVLGTRGRHIVDGQDRGQGRPVLVEEGGHAGLKRASTSWVNG